MKYHAGVLRGEPEWANSREVLVLAHTPGIPIEWVYAAFDLEWRRRRRLLKMMAENDVSDIGRENADTIEQGDGWKMLEAVCPGYSGAVPLWSQIELQNDTRSNAAIGRVLGVDGQKVRRWRTNAVFCPLTGVRLVPNRGTCLNIGHIA